QQATQRKAHNNHVLPHHRISAAVVDREHGRAKVSAGESSTGARQGPHASGRAPSGGCSALDTALFSGKGQMFRRTEHLKKKRQVPDGHHEGARTKYAESVWPDRG